MRIEEAVKLAKSMEGENLTELHIVNGLHPEPAVALLPALAAGAEGRAARRLAQGLHGHRDPPLRDHLRDVRLRDPRRADRRRPGVPDRRRRRDLRLGCVRQHIVDHRTHWEDWSRIHRLAHEKGLKTPCTMLYGHIEEPRHRVDHVLRLRELQDETGGFQVFIPLRYQHDFVDMQDGKVRNRLQARTQMATGAEALKTFAVSPAALRQRPARQGLLGHARRPDGPAGPPARRGRHGRLGRRVQDHARRGRLRHAEQADPRGPARPDPRRRFRPVERNTRYEIIREFEGPTRGVGSRRSRCGSESLRLYSGCGPVGLVAQFPAPLTARTHACRAGAEDCADSGARGTVRPATHNPQPTGVRAPMAGSRTT